MRNVLAHLVVAPIAGDGNGDYRAGVALLEKRRERFQQERLEAGGGVRNIRLHLEIANQVDNLTVKLEGAADIGLRAGDLKNKMRRRDDPVANLHGALDGDTGCASGCSPEPG